MSSGAPDEFLVDYFFVAGLDPDRGLNPFPDLSAQAFDSDNEDGSLFSAPTRPVPPLERAYQPAELCHFPLENPKPHPEFDSQSVTLMAMPHGMRFRGARCSAPRLHHFLITRDDGNRSYGVALMITERVRHHDILQAFVALSSMFAMETAGQDAAPANRGFEPERDALYCEKAIGLLTRQPFLHGLERWLLGLWPLLRDRAVGRSALERHVARLLFRVPCPHFGRAILFPGPAQPRACLAQRPSPLEELPPLEFPLRDLFSLLGVEKVLRVFACLLLEYRVVLLSRSYYALTLTAECLTALLFPFTWSHVYIPVLPANLLHYLDAPVTYLIGVLRPDSETSIVPGARGNCCVVNIDDRTVLQPEEVPAFPDAAALHQELSDLLMAPAPAPPKALQLLLPARTKTQQRQMQRRVSDIAAKSGMTLEQLQVRESRNHELCRNCGATSE